MKKVKKKKKLMARWVGVVKSDNYFFLNICFVKVAKGWAQRGGGKKGNTLFSLFWEGPFPNIFR